MVDDDPDSTHLVKILLERAGDYCVLEENVATKAHQTAQNFKPDLILLDIMMPEMDGGDVAAQIDADPELQGLRSYFSVRWSPEPKQRAVSVSRDIHFLQSPSVFLS